MPAIDSEKQVLCMFDIKNELRTVCNAQEELSASVMLKTENSG